MEVAIMIVIAIALMGVVWILNRKPYTVIGKHPGGDAYPHFDPSNMAPDSAGLTLDNSGGLNLDCGQGAGSSDSSCGDGGGGNQ